MKRQKIVPLRALLDEEEFETADDLTDLLQNEKRFTEFEHIHGSKLPMSTWTKLGKLRSIAPPLAATATAITPVAAATSGAMTGTTPASAAAVTSETATASTASALVAAASTPASAIAPASTATAGGGAPAVPAAPAAAVYPTFPLALGCSSLAKAPSLMVGRSISLPVAWANSTAENIQFARPLVDISLSPFLVLGDHTTVLVPAASGPMHEVVGSWSGGLEWYCAVAMVEPVDSNSPLLRSIDVLNVNVLKRLHLRDAGKLVFRNITERVAMITPSREEGAPSREEGAPEVPCASSLKYLRQLNGAR